MSNIESSEIELLSAEIMRLKSEVAVHENMIKGMLRDIYSHKERMNLELDGIRQHVTGCPSESLVNRSITRMQAEVIGL